MNGAETMRRNELMECVYAHILECPEDAPSVMKACEAGIHEAFNRSAQRAADMESALAQALSPKLPRKVKEKNIREWLTKWKGKCSLKWDWYLDSTDNP